MAKRIKAEDYKVSDPDATMARFKALLGKLVKVPKSEIARENRARKIPKRKRNGNGRAITRRCVRCDHWFVR
jgi:hypothetical protein